MMSNKQNSFSSWPLLAWWTFASLIGWAAGLAVGVLLTLVAGRFAGVNEDRFLVYAILLSVGLTTGVAQWRVMMHFLPQPIQWVAATLIGYLLSLIVIVGANQARLSVAGLWDDVLLLGLIGTAIGTAQWWRLRQHYRGAGVWMLATAVGFLSFMWLVANPAHSLGEFITLGTILGTLAAAAPGAALVWLVRQPLTAAS
jgi:hypothetical protein